MKPLTLDFSKSNQGYILVSKQNPVIEVKSIQLTKHDDNWAVRFNGIVTFKVTAYDANDEFLAAYSENISLTIDPYIVQPIMPVNRKIGFTFKTDKTPKSYSLEIILDNHLLTDAEILTVHCSHELEGDLELSKDDFLK